MQFRLRRRTNLPVLRAGAVASGAFAVGAFAAGALAIGAFAIGSLAIGRMAVGKARIRRLEIDELTVRRLKVIETIQGSHAAMPNRLGQADRDQGEAGGRNRD